METTFIYALHDSNNNVRYIGKSDDPDKRIKSHISNIKYKVRDNEKLTHKEHWIISENYNISISIIEECSMSQWPEREQYHIGQYDNLTNYHKGGLGGGTIKYDMTYEECKVWVANNLEVTSIREYAATDKPDNIPSNPSMVYKKRGWVSWGDFLGTGRVQSNLVNYLTYDKAKARLKRFNLKTSKEFKSLNKANKLTNGMIPNRPERYYMNRGWVSWGDFLGTGTVSCKERGATYLKYEEAKLLVHKLKFKTVKTYFKYIMSLDGLTNLPYNANTFYSEWVSWSDFLGTTIISDNNKHTNYFNYEDAKEYMRTNYPTIKSSPQWKEFRLNNEIDSRVPLNPHISYKRTNTWLGWGDYLGTGNIMNKDKVYLSYGEAKELVQSFNLKNNREWRGFIKKNKHLGLHSTPDRYYKGNGWISWGDWLGTK